MTPVGLPWKDIYSKTAVTIISDQRQKTNISDTTLGLDFINHLRPVDYKWIDAKNIPIYDENGDVIGTEPVAGIRTHHGFIAQEVKGLLDIYGVDSGLWILADKNDSESQQALRYTELIAPAVKAIQALSAQVGDISSNTHLVVDASEGSITLRGAKTIIQGDDNDPPIIQLQNVDSSAQTVSIRADSSGNLILKTDAPASTVTIDSGIQFSSASYKSTDYSPTPSDYSITFDTSGSICTLPPITTSNVGKQYLLTYINNEGSLTINSSENQPIYSRNPASNDQSRVFLPYYSGLFTAIKTGESSYGWSMV
jgi:hypothetical protein